MNPNDSQALKLADGRDAAEAGVGRQPEPLENEHDDQQGERGRRCDRLPPA